MRSTLAQLDNAGQLRLLRSAWGGSYSGTDTFYSGDDAQPTFVRAGANGDGTIINLTATMPGGSEIHGIITEIDDSIDREALANELNEHTGKKVAGLYNEELEIRSRGNE